MLGLNTILRQYVQSITIAAISIAILQFTLIPRLPEHAFWIGLFSYAVGGLILSLLSDIPREKQFGDEQFASSILILLTLSWTCHYLLQGLLVEYEVTQGKLSSFMVYNIVSALCLMLGASIQAIGHALSNWFKRIKNLK